MMEGRAFQCDVCNKIELNPLSILPNAWWSVDSRELKTSKSDYSRHFCSKKCFIEWVEKELK